MRTKLFCWLIILLSGINLLSAQTRPDSSQAGEGLDYLYGTIVGGMNVYLSGSYHLWDFKQNTSNASISYSQDDFLASTLNVSNSNRDTYLFSLKMRPLPQLIFSFRGNFFENYPASSYSSFDSTYYAVTEERRKRENKNRYFLNGDLAFLSNRGKFSFSEQNAKWYYFMNGANFLLSPNQFKLTTQVRFANEENFYSKSELTSIAYPDSDLFYEYYNYSQHSRVNSIDFVQTFSSNLNDRFYINVSGSFERDLQNESITAQSKIYDPFLHEFQETFIDTSLKPKSIHNTFGAGVGVGCFLNQKIYNHLSVHYLIEKDKNKYINYYQMSTPTTTVYNNDEIQISYDLYFMNAKSTITKSKALSKQFYGSTLPVRGFLFKSSVTAYFKKDNRRPRFTHPGNPVYGDWNSGFNYQILEKLSASTIIHMDYFNGGQNRIRVNGTNTYQNAALHELYFDAQIALNFKNYDYADDYYTWEKRRNEEFRYLGPFLKPGWWVCQVGIDFPGSRWKWYTNERNPFSHKVETEVDEFIPGNEYKVYFSNSVGIFNKLSLSSTWSWDLRTGRPDQQYFSVGVNYRPTPRFRASFTGSGNYSDKDNGLHATYMSISGRYFF